MLKTLLFLLTITSSTDSTLNNENPVEVDPIVVVGQREPVRLSKSVNSAIIVTPRKMSELTENNIITYLASGNASVSVSSVRAAGYGLGSNGQGKLLIRGLGFSPNRGTLVMIDGRPDIAGLFGHPLPDTYRRAGLYSAELVKGGASTLYGSNAVAGVLDLQSFYRPHLLRYTNLELTGGSFDTYNSIIQHSQRFDNLVVAGWYEYIESDNHLENNEYFNRSGGFRCQLDDMAGMNIFVSGKYSSFDFTDAGPDYNPERSTGDIQRMGATFGLDWQNDKNAIKLRAYSSYGEHGFSDGFNSIDRNNGLDLFLRHKLNLDKYKFNLSGGGSVNYLGGSAENGTPSIATDHFNEYEYAGHLQAELTIPELLSFTLGGRYIDHERYDDHFVYQVGTVISPDERYGSLKLSVATAYRNPTISELELFPSKNPDSLLPEEGTFYEIGYFNQLHRNFSLEATVFWREGENLIATVYNPSSSWNVTYVNTGSYSHSGWETVLRYNYGAWSFSPSFIHLNQDTYNSSVPEDKFVLNGSFKKNNLSVGFEAVNSFKTHSDTNRPGVTSGEIILDDYFVFNLNNRYEINKNFFLLFNIDNLFDSEYQIIDGYDMPGITIRGGLSIKIY